MHSIIKTFIKTQKLFLPLCLLVFSTSVSAQEAELKQKIEAMKSDFSENFELKYLNINSPDLGYIDDTRYAWKDQFMLKSKEKTENNIGNRGYSKFYISVYYYETFTDRQYALSDWMKDFIEGESIRPGRPVRKLPYATPTIILINPQNIVTFNYKCSDYTYENFDKWKDDLLALFGNDDTMVIEVLCDGPVEWTKNAPDPRTRGLF